MVKRSYQLLFCKRRPTLHTKRTLLSVPRPIPRSSSTHPSTSVLSGSASCFGRFKTKTAGGTPPKKREVLRSLYLPSTRHVELPVTRPKVPRRSRVNQRLCGATRINSPHTPIHRRHYTQLDESLYSSPSPSKHTEKPPAAWISSRSPSYDDVPPTPTSAKAKTRCTWSEASPVPLSPPPAYVRGTPVRRVCQVIGESRTIPPAYSRGDRGNIPGAANDNDSRGGGEGDLPDVVVEESPIVRFHSTSAAASSSSVFVILGDGESDSDSNSIF
ncbi:hypothetical protein BKA93DRAFT_437113 [Sparassis latifolia]